MGAVTALTAPETLAAEHDVSQFENQHDSLAEWLRRHALANQAGGASRTFVVCDGHVVVAYYALAAASVEHAAAPRELRRNMPSPIPAILLARLAVDRRHQGQGLGADLLRDAVLRSLQVAQSIGARAMLCHAIDEAACGFYAKPGFREFPAQTRTMLLDLAKVVDVL